MGAVKKAREAAQARNGRRAISLRGFYLKYFAYLFAGVVAATLAVFFMFELVAVNGLVYPAYYAEQQARAAEEKIAAAERVEETLIPALCTYAVFDADGTFRAGNLTKKAQADAWRAVEEGTKKSGGWYYTVVARDGEYCVLQYAIVPQYHSPVLRRYLPNPQNLLFLCWVCAALAVVVLTAVRFGRAMTKKLAPLISVTERIGREELDFAAPASDVRELDAVLRAFDDMREALRQSLERQWSLEQERKEQLLALAHDLKTPLTLVRGNAELLCETPVDAEQRECAAVIERSAGRMQRYVETMIEIMRDGYRIKPCGVETASLLEDAAEQLRELCAAKGLSAEQAFSYQGKDIVLDRALFMRALVNVFANAAEYTAAGGTIFFEVCEEKDAIAFTVTDTGCGFSGEALRHAKEQFFSGDKSRGQGAHSGIGLYLADLVARGHGGELILENSKETGGARVCIKIPKKTEGGPAT